VAKSIVYFEVFRVR